MPSARPTWLAGALVQFDDDGIDHHVSIKCVDGAEYVISVIQYESSRADKEAAERQRAKNLEEFYKIPLEVRRQQVIDEANNMETRFRESHSAKIHEGTWEACSDEICLMMKKLIADMRGDIYIPETDDDLIA